MHYESRAKFDETFANVAGVTASEMKASFDEVQQAYRWIEAVAAECTNVALEGRIRFTIFHLDGERLVEREYFTYGHKEKVSWNKIKSIT